MRPMIPLRGREEEEKVRDGEVEKSRRERKEEILLTYLDDAVEAWRCRGG